MVFTEAKACTSLRRRLVRRATAPAALAALLIAGILLVGGCAAQTVWNIDPQEAFDMIRENQANVDFVVLDVRTREEYDGGHIEDAMVIDFYGDDFKDRLGELDRSKTYVIYCRSGARSASALETMDELGFKQVYNVLGGMIQWTAEGLPTVK